MNVWYGTSGDELTSLLRSIAQPVGKKAGAKQVDLVEGKDFQEKETEKEVGKDCNGPMVKMDIIRAF